MTYAELTKAIVEVIPGASFSEGINGEVIIYSNLKKPNRDNDPLEALPVLDEEVFNDHEDV